ncbi:N-acetyltransferase [Vibrio sp. T187]|uniref:GNAT family N-acetyltransferase n=1 Tax=Vibrio TaxID=662 RepID=UPI0010C93DEE|nr:MULTISPECIES: GNAT family N-acetyltransferase [Vibrio]MBW3695576.1 N-acetyltransferase [Vibrio sp. T187]
MEIEVIANPAESDVSAVHQGIKDFNRPHFPDVDIVPLGCFIRDENKNIIAGLTAECFTTSLFINYLWVSPEYRGDNLGGRLMKRIESEALARGVEDMCLDTYSFQALDFYLKQGFTQVGEFTNYPTKGINKYLLQKCL